jgi:hypothetical protein
MYTLFDSPSSSSFLIGGTHSLLSFPIDEELDTNASSGIAASKMQERSTSTGIRVARDTNS